MEKFKQQDALISKNVQNLQACNARIDLQEAAATSNTSRLAAAESELQRMSMALELLKRDADLLRDPSTGCLRPPGLGADHQHKDDEASTAASVSITRNFPNRVRFTGVGAVRQRG